MRVFLALSVVLFFFLMVEMAPPRFIFEEHLNSKFCPRMGCTTDTDCHDLIIHGFYCTGKLNEFIFAEKF